MSRIPTRSGPDKSRHRPSGARSQKGAIAVILAVWMAVQTLALTLAALRVPLWARAPEAGETLAIPILLIVQILSASLLSPRLTSNWRSTLMAIACTWPFLVLAGLLGATPVATILLAAAYVTGWLIVLWIWQVPLGKVKANMVGAAMAATWSAAGPVLLFIHVEYGGGSAPNGFLAQTAVGPLIHALRVVDPDAGQPLTHLRALLIAVFRSPRTALELLFGYPLVPWTALVMAMTLGGGARILTAIISGKGGGSKWEKSRTATDLPGRTRATI